MKNSVQGQKSVDIGWWASAEFMNAWRDFGPAIPTAISFLSRVCMHARG